MQHPNGSVHSPYVIRRRLLHMFRFMFHLCGHILKNYQFKLITLYRGTSVCDRVKHKDHNWFRLLSYITETSIKRRTGDFVFIAVVST